MCPEVKETCGGFLTRLIKTNLMPKRKQIFLGKEDKTHCSDYLFSQEDENREQCFIEALELFLACSSMGMTTKEKTEAGSVK